MAWLDRFGWLLGPKNTEAKIVLVGLVNSGKSTIMQQLKPGHIKMAELLPNIPIAGLHAEHFKYKSLTFVAFDLGDNDGFGNPWEDHFRDCHGIIFVVDSADRMNIPLVNMELEKVVKKHIMNTRRSIPLLVLANKCDQPSAVASLQMGHLLNIRQISTGSAEVYSSDGLTGEGLNEALDWFALRLKQVCAK